MISLRSLFPLCLLAIASANPGRGKIQWGPCEDNEFDTTLTVECGTLRVPLDYTQPVSSKRLNLGIVRVPAPVQPSKGSIQFNFGGPGEEARQTLVAFAAILQAQSGGVYDLLTFDPRGVGKTLPFSCAHDPFYVSQLTNGLRGGDESDTALRTLWARGEIDANICQQFGNGNETGELIGTAYMARDMMSIVDALGEDGMLRYWGYSYGTTLGATLAAMFPERIDKLIIDGVQNAHEYYNAHADFEEGTDADKAVSYFFESCVDAGPELCVLAAQNKTAAELEQDMWDFMNTVREAPIPVGVTIFDVDILKGFVVGQLKTTHSWPAMAELMVALFYGSEETRRAVLQAHTAELLGDVTPTSLGTSERLFGIHCSDRTVRADTFEEVAPVFEKLSEISKLEGASMHVLTAHCAQWPWRAKEVYSGDFHVKTKNPILLVNNRIDAHTPMKSARNISSGFEGSSFLEIDGIGHTSINVPSVCALKEFAAYWVNGTLPKPGKVCKATPAWGGYTWGDVLKGLSGGNVTAS